MRGRTIGILAGVYVLLLILGGVSFHFLESENEEETATASRDVLDALLESRPCLSEEDLETLIRRTIEAYDQGIIVLPNSTSVSNWDIASSIFFSCTIATTIGYGNISPATRGGKIFAVFFACVSIPICLVMLAGIGQKLAGLANKLEEKMKGIAWCSKHPKTGKILRLLVIFFLFFFLLMTIPAIIFLAIEDWDYRDALYYCFITVTTIGFGDFVAGTGESDYRALYRICLIGWILIGLAYMSTLISMAQEATESFVTKAEVEAEKEEGEDKEKEVKDPEKGTSKPGSKQGSAVAIAD